MPIYALGEEIPEIHPTAFVHPDAVVIGAVVIGQESSVWPAAVLRGDHGRIRIGSRTSVQDGTVVHTTPRQHTVVGDNCVIGHNVHVEGCTIGNDCLIGSGSVVLNGAVVENGAAVGAAALVPEGVLVPTGQIALGVPARLRDVPAGFTDWQPDAVAKYCASARRYMSELRRIG